MLYCILGHGYPQQEFYPNSVTEPVITTHGQYCIVTMSDTNIQFYTNKQKPSIETEKIGSVEFLYRYELEIFLEDVFH